MAQLTKAQYLDILEHPTSPLEQLGVSPSLNNLIGTGALLGAGAALGGVGDLNLGVTGEDTTAGAGEESGGGSTTKSAAAGAGASAAANGLKTLAKDATTGALLSTLLGDGYLKYAAIWAGLLVLGIALVLMGLSRNGVKTPNVPIVVPA